MSQFFMIMTTLLVILNYLAKDEKFMVRLLIKMFAVIFFALLITWNPFFFAAIGVIF